ncbi:hypothetical protein BRAS3843_2290007 [Bradyrhizobium sp. STM 3843]|uniref:DUF3383 family protein n=1 Tax=Bradyrhizobium sp. STM 3843 TaxID=551947 RepID=UPI0002403025|nr:DUF3383 family protein [Bradyrhizobium sp. STM 3843]CCE07596.1 hypothetical protein BRAS3843_2290007 [Bradyrhizobium sp. STM 3843]
MSTIPASIDVNVTPSVIATGGSALDLNGLFLTTNTRVPIGTVLSLAPADVADFFGGTSVEATKAAVYGAGFDNSDLKPGAMLWAQYPIVAVAAYLRGGNVSALTLGQLQAITGQLSVTVDSVQKSGNVDLSAATSFSAAAQIIQTDLGLQGLQAAQVTATIAGEVMTVTAVESGAIVVGLEVTGAGIAAGTYVASFGTGTGGAGTYNLSVANAVAVAEALTLFAPAVTYDSLSGAFVIASGTVGHTSAVTFATGAVAASLLLTQATGAVLSPGADAATPGPFMTSVTQLTQNWATFQTVFDPDNGQGNDNKFAFALWNSLQNNRWGYVCIDHDPVPAVQNPAPASLGQRIKAANISGTNLNWEPTDQNIGPFMGGFPASLDFSKTGGRFTAKFRKQAGLLPGVTDLTTAQNLAANGYNFYAAVATANQQFTYYRNGTVSGEFLWWDSYVNQIWMNNQIQLDLLTFMQAIGTLPYNAAGNAAIETALADTITRAEAFGVFVSGVELSAAQITALNRAAPGKNIAPVLQSQGYYLLIGTATPDIRAQRGSPPLTFFYTDGQSVHSINIGSVAVQ